MLLSKRSHAATLVHVFPGSVAMSRPTGRPASRPSSLSIRFVHAVADLIKAAGTGQHIFNAARFITFSAARALMSYSCAEFELLLFMTLAIVLYLLANLEVRPNFCRLCNSFHFLLAAFDLSLLYVLCSCFLREPLASPCCLRSCEPE